MAFKINISSETQDNVTIGERLWLTADKDRVVQDGDPEAAFLFCAPGNSIERREAERFGLVGKKHSQTATPPPADAGDGSAATTDDGAAAAAPATDPATLKKMTKPQLVAHAATLDPPLELDEASKKDEMLAAINSHEPTPPPADAGDGSAATTDDGAASS